MARGQISSRPVLTGLYTILGTQKADTSKNEYNKKKRRLSSREVEYEQIPCFLYQWRTVDGIAGQ
jgi:hypothetical protein